MKGTLEELVNENPDASSTERIQEHYLAYVSAHRTLHDPR